MEHAEVKEFKRILQAMLAEMQKSRRRQDEIPVENVSDALDQVQLATARDLAISRIESDFSRLQSLKLALERVEDGSYGTCLRCDRDISPKRLRVIPWAAYCVRCQEIADQERKQAGRQEFDEPVNMRDVA